ncbi:hypothetical protein [Ethanoligenens sp.]|uniref:hypothetical protein n=1 Tax=Ethanoligenens sp. TaxID=2099655 RepID=UPI0039E8C039
MDVSIRFFGGRGLFAPERLLLSRLRMARLGDNRAACGRTKSNGVSFYGGCGNGLL